MPPEKPNVNEQEEYRRRQAQRAQKRKKQRVRQLVFLGVCALAVVVLVLAVVLVVRAIVAPSAPKKANTSSLSSSVSALPVATPVAADPSVWNLLLINAQNPMPEGFAPALETHVQNGVGFYLDARMLPDLQRLLTDYNAVEGNSLQTLVAAPGADKQNAKFQSLVEVYKAEGNDQTTAEQMARQVEPPYGSSDHQTCLAVDFGTATVTETSQSFAQTPEYAWLLANAPKYGFILRFPENKAAITGVTFQPYHFRYVGVEDAQAIMNAGICLEEYVAAQPAVPPAAASSTVAASTSAVA